MDNVNNDTIVSGIVVLGHMERRHTYRVTDRLLHVAVRRAGGFRLSLLPILAPINSDEISIKAA